MTDLDWRQQAECRRYPSELWFPDHSNQSRPAIEICVGTETRPGCPVRRQCAADAVKRGEKWAIVAGFRCGEKKERDALEAWLGTPVVPAPKPRHYVRSENTGRCVDCHMPTASRVNRKRNEARYGGKGRCERCYQVLRREEQKADDPKARIPADAAREHAKSLAAMMTLDEIVALAGISKSVLNGLLYGFRGKPRLTISKEDAAKVFSVQVGVSA
ncbi:WhiB family transcriptional regulator [Nocardia sp. Marseille-Q1738]